VNSARLTRAPEKAMIAERREEEGGKKLNEMKEVVVWRDAGC
jgi:hypothetical protein